MAQRAGKRRHLRRRMGMDAVATTIARYQMLAPGARVIAAVSGGPDSVCLFHVLRDAGASVCGIAHLNHQLRGAASDEDQRFVANLAAQAGVPFYVERVNLSGTSGNLEQAARRARHAFFTRLIREGAADRVATGHTRDDQAETVLFRLLRGAGLAGLAGILPVTEEGLIRPLLNVSRAQVVQYLQSRGIGWREDTSNRERRFARNRIRMELLPQLARDWNPRINETLAHMADLAYEEERWWRGEIARLAQEFFVTTEGGIEVQASRLTALPKAVARRLIRHGVGKTDFDHVERILDLARSPRGRGKLELPGLEVVRSFDWLRWSGRSSKVFEAEPVPIHRPGRYVWGQGSVSVEAPCARLKLELRGWRAGDSYCPAGRSREQSLRELFQQARVPSWRRRSWPIVTAGSKILWARQFGPAAGTTQLRIWEGNSAQS